MGCVESRLESDLQTNIFHVVNVNERGQRQRSARLEVTDTHLILHQRGRKAIGWPLRCLRRYGFDAEQFSFESGRRSPLGPGIYTFKCRRAEALFNLLQFQIQNIAEDTASRDLSSLPLNDTRELLQTDPRTSAAVIDYQHYLEPFTRPRARTSVLGSLSGPPISSPPHSAPAGANGGIGAFSTSMRSPSSPAPLSPPVVSIFSNQEAIDSSRGDNTREPPTTPGGDATPSIPLEASRNIIMNYVDRTVQFVNHSEIPSSYSSSGSDRPVSYVNYVGPNERPVNYHKINMFKQTLESESDLLKCQQHLYMNVDTDMRREGDHVYANLGLDKDMSIIPARVSGGSGSSHSGTTTTTDTEQPINYTQVDIERGSDSSHTAPLSPLLSLVTMVSDVPRAAPMGTTPLEYSMIDFDKTEALSSTAALWKATGDGTRRSRHNSTFSAITPLGRHNSTLSD